MSMFEIYLIMQLDVISTFLWFAALFLPAFIVPYAIGLHEIKPDKSQIFLFKLMIVVEVCFIILAVLTPDTKTAATMVVGEKITNNPALIESADKGVKLLPKVIDAVDVYLNKKGGKDD